MSATPIPKAKKLATELLTPLIEAGKISELELVGPPRKPKDWILVRVRHPEIGPLQISLGFWRINYSEDGKNDDMRLHFKLYNPDTPEKASRLKKLGDILGELHVDYEKAVGHAVLKEYFCSAPPPLRTDDNGRDLMFKTPFAFEAEEIARVLSESVKFFVKRLNLTRY